MAENFVFDKDHVKNINDAASEHEANNLTRMSDYFVEKNGQQFAGIHLLIDFWEATNLSDRVKVEKALKDAAIAANATIIKSKIKKYSENGGITGILILAESHMSIHTWPELSFAAIDIFMCGSCNPYNCIAALQQAFEPRNTKIFERQRGVFP